MCRCNKKYSTNLDHVRMLAALMKEQSGETQYIFATPQGYNFGNEKTTIGKNVIETV